MQNPPYTQSQFCNYADGQTPPEINHEAKPYTETEAGHLEATLATAQNLAIDGAGAALFYLTLERRRSAVLYTHQPRRGRDHPAICRRSSDLNI